MTDQPDSIGDFVVVVNDEGQYSVWWQGRRVPAGWRLTGVMGSRVDCLARVAQLWTDQRPRSLVEFLARQRVDA